MNRVSFDWQAQVVLHSVAFFLVVSSAQADIQRLHFSAGGNRLTIECWDDDLLHLEYDRGGGTDPAAALPIPTSEMICGDALTPSICTTIYDGAQGFVDHGDGQVETADLRVVVDRANLIVSVFDKTKHDLLLTTIRAEQLDQPAKSLVFTRTPQLDVYGLGQQFVDPGNASIDWDGRIREGGPSATSWPTSTMAHRGIPRFP